MTGLGSVRIWIQVNRARFRFIRGEFTHHIGLMGSLQPCDHVLAHIYLFMTTYMLGAIGLRLIQYHSPPLQMGSLHLLSQVPQTSLMGSAL